MILNYLLTLATTVAAVTMVAASLPFATSSQVLSGKVVDENLRWEFTLDAGGDNYYKVSPELARSLQAGIGIETEGPPHVIAVETEVTPKRVSWTENRTTYTAPGAAMTIHLRWDTPADSANGSRGLLYLHFPAIPGVNEEAIDMRSGPYQKDNAGRYVIREATTYRSKFQLALARFVFALAAGLPFGVVLHTIGWAFVVKRERRSRLSELQRESGESPQTFYPDPAAEWSSWLLVLGIGALVSSMLAGFSVYDGFMSSSFALVVYILLGSLAAIAGLVTYLVRKRLLTVRVDSEGISYARGRENLQWISAVWSDILSMAQKSRTYRGNTTHWIEIEFNDSRKKLKIGQSLVGYSTLCNLLASKVAQ